MNNEKQQTIFIVDDNPENLRILSEILEQEGYLVRASLNGAEMLQSISHEKPHLIILDIHMPQMDGYEVCGTLKNSPEFAGIPVIFCSALNDTFNIVKSFEIGGVDYIAKPFRRLEVLARIRTHLAIEEKERNLKESLANLEAVQLHLIQAEKMTSLGTLIAGIAHEINNPINYIISSLEGFRRGFHEILEVVEQCRTTEAAAKAIEAVDYPYLTTELESLLDGIRSGAEAVHHVVTSLKAVSLDEELPERKVEVRPEIDRAVSIIRTQLPERISFTTELSPLPRLLLPPGQLTRLLLFLLANAVAACIEKAANPAAEDDLRILISGTQLPDETGGSGWVCISVSDTGVGMDERVIARAIDPFFTTKPAGSASGLGLSACYQIMSKLGGDLKIESSLQRGSTITLIFPVPADN